MPSLVGVEAVSCMVRAQLEWLVGAVAGPSIVEVAPSGFAWALGVLAGGPLAWVGLGTVLQLEWPSWTALEVVAW